MPIMFNSLLTQQGIAPVDVRLLRHQDTREAVRRTPYELWVEERPAFESYHSLQGFSNRKKLDSPIWAEFVGTPDGATMFVGLYAAKHRGLLQKDTPQPHSDGIDRAGSCDSYELRHDDRLADLEGKLFVEWGKGKKAWIQRADRQNKPITELRPKFKEPDFPGFLDFIKPLSEIPKLPRNWIEVLKNTTGIYLLTCPRTKEQYVGQAAGAEGFWGRWMDYVRDRHGGNVALKGREPSDYQVSILEVAGSRSDVGSMESLWMQKLQSKEMGLNRNL